MTSNSASPHTQNRTALFIAAALLLVAFVLRVYSVGEVPPGLTHDEVSELDVATQVRNGEWRLLYPGGFAEDGSEPGYYPFLSAAQSIWGSSSLARRLPSLFSGMIGLACLYVLSRRMFGRQVGLITLGAATVVWWSILMSRVILREVLEVPLYALALYSFWRGFELANQPDRPRVPLRPFLLAGFALGVLQYVHTIPRGLFLVFILFGVYLWLLHRPLFKRVWRGILVLVIMAELTAAPVVITASLNPDIDNEQTLFSLRLEGEEGLIQRVRSNTFWILGQFMFAGDSAWEFNIPYRPVFQPPLAILFGLGVLVTLRRFRRPAMAFVLIVLFVSLLPGILFKPFFPFARLVSAQTVGFAFVGLGVEAIGSGLSRFVSGKARAIGAAVSLGGLFAITLIGTVQDMLVAWPVMPQTRSTYNADLRDLARYLDAQPQPPDVSQCTLWIIYPWRPRYHLAVAQAAMPYFMQRRDVDVRWHDCRYSFVIPASGQFVYAHSDLHPLSDFLGRLVRKSWLDEARPIPGLKAALQVDARSALAAKLTEWRQLSVTWPPEVTGVLPAELPVNFGNRVELIGYRIRPKSQSVRPGENVAVVTYWRVTGSVPDDLIVFTHLYRTPVDIMAQQDQFDADGSDLKPGDIFAQVHEFIRVPPDTLAGSYWIGVGLYDRLSGERFPIFANDQRAGDRIFLTQIRVER